MAIDMGLLANEIDKDVGKDINWMMISYLNFILIINFSFGKKDRTLFIPTSIDEPSINNQD